MKYLKVFLLPTLFLITDSCFGQLEWENWNMNNSPLFTNSINSLDIDANNNIWMATNYGVVKFDGSNWTFYNHSNSPIPNNVCYAIATEGNTIWVGSVWGLVKFDGATNWTTYSTSNSGLPYDYIISIDVDINGNKWIGTLDAFGIAAGGVTKFDGTNWVTYDTSNSDLSSNWAFDTFVDRTNVKWIGSTNGLNIFNDTVWINYTPGNSGLPNLSVGKIREDQIDSLYWIGTNNGLALYNKIQNSWSIFDTSNSIPNNEIGDIEIDSLNRKWVSCHYSIAMYDNVSWTIFDTNNVGNFLQYPGNLSFDRHGGLWITTGYGLVFYGDTTTLINTSVTNLRFIDPEIDIFPIPSSNVINIRLGDNDMLEAIFIYDTYGNNVSITNWESIQKSRDERLNVSSLKSGLYFIRLKIKNCNKDYIQKIIISN